MDEREACTFGELDPSLAGTLELDIGALRAAWEAEAAILVVTNIDVDAALSAGEPDERDVGVCRRLDGAGLVDLFHRSGDFLDTLVCDFLGGFAGHILGVSNDLGGLVGGDADLLGGRFSLDSPLDCGLRSRSGLGGRSRGRLDPWASPDCLLGGFHRGRLGGLLSGRSLGGSLFGRRLSSGLAGAVGLVARVDSVAHLCDDALDERLESREFVSIKLIGLCDERVEAVERIEAVLPVREDLVESLDVVGCVAEFLCVRVERLVEVCEPNVKSVPVLRKFCCCQVSCFLCLI